MKCPDVAAQCPENAGQKGGTGLARAYRERDIVPVPFPVPNTLADVPIAVTACQESQAVVWWLLDQQFQIAIKKRHGAWTTVHVANRSRRPRGGSWRISWSEKEQRFAVAAELQDMDRRFPHLRALAEVFCRACLAPARAFAGGEHGC